MALAAPPVTSWLEQYHRHRDDLFVSRLRWSACLTLGGVLCLLLLFCLRGVHDWTHTGFGLVYALLGLAAALAVMAGPGRRQPEVIAAALVSGIIANMALSFPYTPDQQYAAPSALVATTLGSAIYFPFAVRWQAIIGAATIAAYGWILHSTNAAGASAEITLVASAAAASVVSARLIERYRVTSFERSWQQEQLAALARELAQCLESCDAAAAVSARASQLLGCPWVVVSIHDEARQLFRIESAAGLAGSHHMNLVGLEIPADYPLTRDVIERGVLVLPDDAPGHPVWAPLAAWGLERVVYLTMRHGTDVVGVLQLGRYTPVRFTAGEYTLARALADHAALAFRTIRLVSDLRRANQLKSDFVSMVSHEFRTPVNVIMGMTDMVLDGSLTEEQRDLLQRVRRAADGLFVIINNILDLSKIEAGKMTIAQARMDLRATVRDALSLLLIPAEQKGLTLRGVVAPDVPEHIHGDAERLRQVLTNLIGNAIKFTERGGIVLKVTHVSPTPTESAVRLAVCDTGIGIPREQRATIFESFSQVDSIGISGRTGTGLGLAISKELVTLMGGTIGVDSAVGVGSTFWIEIPLTTAHNASTGAGGLAPVLGESVAEPPSRALPSPRATDTPSGTAEPSWHFAQNGQ